jgi:hypothetical protein
MRILLDAPDSDMTSFRVSDSFGTVSEPTANIPTEYSVMVERVHSAPLLTSVIAESVNSNLLPTNKIIDTAYEPESDNNFSSESEGDCEVNFQN